MAQVSATSALQYFGPGGYSIMLEDTQWRVKDKLDELVTNKWADHRTRALIIEVKRYIFWLLGPCLATMALRGMTNLTN